MTNNLEVNNNHEKSMDTVKKKGLWNPKNFIVISILFSFLPSAIMYSINYGRLNNKRKRNISLIIYGLIFIIFLASTFLLDEVISNSMFRSIFIGLNIGIAIYLRYDQIKLYESYIEDGGKKASIVIPVIICLTFTLLTVGAIVYTYNYNYNIPNTYQIIQGDELYYTENISLDEVEKLGEYLEDTEMFFNDDNSISVKVDKIESDYIFSLIVLEEDKDDEEVIEIAKTLSQYLSSDVFNNNKVIVNLCDDRFNVLNSITYR